MKKCCFVFQRACYLSLNPQKDETLETEKAQYTLPDGSTLDVRMRLLIYMLVYENMVIKLQIISWFCWHSVEV